MWYLLKSKPEISANEADNKTKSNTKYEKKHKKIELNKLTESKVKLKPNCDCSGSTPCIIRQR